MQIIGKQYSDINIDYDLEQISPLEDILFLDIETTGFSASTSNLYLIGCGYYQNGSFSCKQFFAEKPDEEEEILKEFIAFSEKYKLLIHFNGNNFDIPYIQEKCKKYNIESTLDTKPGIDIYRRISPYKSFMKVPNCKQKTLEQYIGISREDIYSGGDLINVYHEYVQLFNVDSLAKLLLHNENDIQGMIELTPILAFSDLFNKPIKVVKVNMDRYKDLYGNDKLELIMKCTLPSKLPTSITEISNGMFFQGDGNTALIKCPVYEGELKYFYANYKDYYYLPTEDQAMHKSVSKFVDKDHRVQANAQNCYTRVTSKFVKTFSLIASPFFKTDYQSKDLYIELTPERKKDRQFFSDYASHILRYMAGMI